MIRRQVLESRLAELRADFQAGEAAMRDLEMRRDQLQVSMLRVGGAIQVLDELLSFDSTAGDEPAPPVAFDRAHGSAAAM